MNSTLEQIKPETLALIEERAKNLNLSVDEYLRSFLPESEKNLALKSGTNDDERAPIIFLRFQKRRKLSPPQWKL